MMHPDLERIASEFSETQAKIHRLAEQVDETTWITRPAPNSWSIDECVAHLNLTNERFLPLLDEVADAAPRWLNGPDGNPVIRPMRRDFAGWFLSWMMEPPVRFRLPTSAPFVPQAPASRSATVAAFDATQSRLLAKLPALDGYDLSTIRIISPFNASLKYGAWSALCILAAHERRHLWQAERARQKLQGTRT